MAVRINRAGAIDFVFINTFYNVVIPQRFLESVKDGREIRSQARRACDNDGLGALQAVFQTSDRVYCANPITIWVFGEVLDLEEQNEQDDWNHQ